MKIFFFFIFCIFGGKKLYKQYVHLCTTVNATRRLLLFPIPILVLLRQILRK